MPTDAIIAAASATGATVFLAKLLISRSLRELERVAEKITSIQASLANISAKIESFDKDRGIVLIHDRKIAAMENEIYARRSRKTQPAN